MAKLKITFENMFLLVRSNPPVVLLPKGGADYPHSHKVRGVKAKPDPTGSDFTICIVTDGEATPWPGDGPSEWPDSRILDLCSLSASTGHCQIKRALYSRDSDDRGSAMCPNELNARFFLPHGQFTDWQNDKVDHHLTQRWEVPHRSGKPTNTILRDTMIFECDLPDDSLFVLREEMGRMAPVYHALQSEKGKDVSLQVEAKDKGRYVPSPFAKDFAVIYGLTVNPSGWPVPKMRGTGGNYIPFPKQGSPVGPTVGFGPLTTDPERPICGAGQGCPEP